MVVPPAGHARVRVDAPPHTSVWRKPPRGSSRAWPDPPPPCARPHGRPPAVHCSWSLPPRLSHGHRGASPASSPTVHRPRQKRGEIASRDGPDAAGSRVGGAVLHTERRRCPRLRRSKGRHHALAPHPTERRQWRRFVPTVPRLPGRPQPTRRRCAPSLVITHPSPLMCARSTSRRPEHAGVCPRTPTGFPHPDAGHDEHDRDGGDRRGDRDGHAAHDGDVLGPSTAAAPPGELLVLLCLLVVGDLPHLRGIDGRLDAEAAVEIAAQARVEDRPGGAARRGRSSTRPVPS